MVHLVTLHSASCPAGKGEDTEMNTEGEASEMINIKVLLMIILMLRMNVCEATSLKSTRRQTDWTGWGQTEL